MIIKKAGILSTRLRNLYDFCVMTKTAKASKQNIEVLKKPAPGKLIAIVAFIMIHINNGAI
jgi:hypothetical protein